MNQKIEVKVDEQGNALDEEFLKEWRVYEQPHIQSNFNPATLFEAQPIDQNLQHLTSLSLSLGLPIQNLSEASLLHSLLLQNLPQLKYVTKRRQRLSICFVLACIATRQKLYQVEEQILKTFKLEETQWSRYRRQVSKMIMDNPNLSNFWPYPKPNLQWWCLKFCQKYSIRPQITNIVTKLSHLFEQQELFSSCFDKTRAAVIIVTVMRCSNYYCEKFSGQEIVSFYDKTPSTVLALLNHEGVEKIKQMLKEHVPVLKSLFT